MQLKFKNQELVPAQKFLNEMTVTGAQQNIARVRLVTLIGKKLKEVEEDRMTAIKQFACLDENGNPKIKGNNYDIPDNKMPFLTKAVRDLQEAESAITIDDYQPQIKALREVLLNYNEPLKGQDAASLVGLIDKIEVAGIVLKDTEEKEGK